MDLLSLIIASTLLIVAMAIIGFFFKVVFENISANPRLWSEKWRLKRKERVLAMADEQITKGQIERAYPLLRQAFLLEGVGMDSEMLEKIHTHHLEILERVVAIGERSGSHLDNLPIVEGLLQARTDLMKACYEIQLSKTALNQRRKEKGQDTPEWAVSEFTKRLAELEERLVTNRKSLDSQLATLFSSLSRLPGSKEVTYH
jgi:hypothetical protein